MEEYADNHGHKPRRIEKDYFQFLHPSPSQTPPALMAAYVSLLGFAFSGCWFAVSLIGYSLIWKYGHPLPEGETMNIELIFNHTPLNRWAVNVVVSWFVCTFMLIQTLFLVAYRIDRRLKRDLAREIFKNPLIKSTQDTDKWDQKEVCAINTSFTAVLTRPSARERL